MSIENKSVKKVLITAKNSYVGNSFASWVSNDERYSLDFISCRNDDWKQSSFSNYDVILHVAGIAHVDASSGNEELYYQVNRDLTIQLAEKSKNDGVSQFIFLSSMIVFGESNINNPYMVVNNSSKPNPSSFYGASKLQAEQGIAALQDEKFKIAIIRPPMIYGEGSKGNFSRLTKIAKVSPFFPNIKNKRSMLYINSLCEFVRLIINNEDQGVFHPQNKEYVNITELVYTIRQIHGKKVVRTKLFNVAIKLISRKINVVNKVFGTFIYDQNMSVYKEEYCVTSLYDSVKQTVRGET
ncbi:NAD-dependent epimerase/dehydratase family protein [Paenibacillus sp. IITD108]|uniref:NAD-dependent epimerase/dehydratase family protein n=1 Tax=Paenibacillus sp. IITD108 TaxID=3116649 RepID=UPI002F3FF7F3